MDSDVSSDFISDVNSDVNSDDDVKDFSEEDMADSTEDEEGDQPGVEIFSAQQEELQEAKATQHQLEFWDELLQLRIIQQKVQKCTNELPTSFDYYQELLSRDEELQELQRHSQQSVNDTLKLLITLEKHSYSPKSHQNQEGACSDGDTEAELKTLSNELRAIRPNVLTEWEGKTGPAKGFDAFHRPLQQQINQILSDQERLISRTQIIRSSYKPMDCMETSPVTCVNVFDDDDFYSQLLRELINRKTAEIKDPIAISRLWVKAQRTKMKKKIDTKASKERKLRFNVHKKLQNFMMPITTIEMAQDARCELFGNLFK